MRLRNRASKADDIVGWPATPVVVAKMQVLMAATTRVRSSWLAHAAPPSNGALADALVAWHLLNGAEAVVVRTRGKLKNLCGQQSARHQGGIAPASAQ